MNTIDEIKKLSIEEKLRVMEALWDDLSRTDMEIASPEWHENALRETERRYKTGEEKAVDWNEAKNTLRNRFE